MSLAELKSICEQKAVQKIAMIDDIFDVPTAARLDRDAFRDFRRAYDADEILRKAIVRVSGMPQDALPPYADLEEHDIEPMWRALWKSQLGGRRLGAAHHEALRQLFTAHADDPLGMLDVVLDLLALFRRDLERTVTVHGVDYDADAVAKADIVLVDFFLGHNITAEEALERSSKAVADVAEAARRAGRAAPSFLLVSSRPDEINVEAFRTRSALMKSRFRFFPKRALRPDNPEDLVNLHDLVDASDRAAVVEGLMEDWKSGASKAIEAVHKRMLELDIADLVYLDCFRLTHEGTTIGNYLRWFLTASLHARVTTELSAKTWKKADGLRLFSVLDDKGEIDPTSLVKTFDGPSDVIAAAYGDILFDSTRGTGEQAFPSTLPPADLMEGDLFIKPRGRDRKTVEGAEVRMVMTPSCDLLPRQDGSGPGAKTVLLISGRLRAMREKDMDTAVTDEDFVRLIVNDAPRVFQIDWDLKSPVSIDWEVMSTAGAGRGFKRLGRIRDLYLHKVRDRFANTLTRIGTEVPPLFPRPKAGAVLIAVTENGSRRFQKVMDFAAKDELVWEIGPVNVRNSAGKAEAKSLYQASRKFGPRLTLALQALRDPAGPLATSATECLTLLANLSNYMDLLRPMKPGQRGSPGAVDFKVAVAPGSKLSSDAAIIVQPYVEGN